MVKYELDQLFDLDPKLRAKISINEQTGCWIWTGWSDHSKRNPRSRYGRIRRIKLKPNGMFYIHVYVRFLLTGESAPLGYEHHHDCRNTLCCNPNRGHVVLLHEDEHDWVHREMTAYGEEIADLLPLYSGKTEDLPDLPF